MILVLITNNILAKVLPSLRILTLFLLLMITITILYAAALLVSVVYIQSIGSGIGTIDLIFLSSVLPLKVKRLTKKEKAEFTLTKEHKDILIGLLLGDVFAEKRTPNGNTRIRFDQGIEHEAYLLHLYDLFKGFCASTPITINRQSTPKTGLIYSSNYFATFSLPCFNELHSLFYREGRKIVPLNIAELLTPSGLAYLISDDGTYQKSHNFVKLCTESFIESDVDLLIQVLENKFKLECRKEKRDKGFRIVIKRKSLETLQKLVCPHLHSSMLYKVGL